ncbi:MAG TPA: alpha/beta hydrolase [Tepidisphaeraceae bacterium]|jgi:pimeloyl-ACP methyl ester carboxylesterase
MTSRFLCLLVFFSVGGCADKLLLRPPPSNPVPRHATEVKIANERLALWRGVSQPAGAGDPDVFVLELCGNWSSAEQVIDQALWRWRQHRAEVWALNYPGYGHSAGAASLASLTPSALIAADALLVHANGRPVIIEANSIGTAPALYVASLRPIAGLVLMNPPPIKQLIWRYSPLVLGVGAFWFDAQVPADMNSERNAAAVHAPAIFAIAGRDRVTPPELRGRIIMAYAGPKLVLPLELAGHNDGADELQEQRLQTAMRWLLASAHVRDEPPSARQEKTTLPTR